MEFEAKIALIISILLTLAYAYFLLKNFLPFIKHTHRSNILKEHGDLISAEAEVVEVEQRDLNGLKAEINRLYVMRIKYNTDNAAQGMEHSELVFAKKPPESTGQKIKILYSRDDPHEAITPDSRETNGITGLYLKLILSLCIAFAFIFAVMYCFCKFGLPD